MRTSLPTFQDLFLLETGGCTLSEPSESYHAKMLLRFPGLKEGNRSRKSRRIRLLGPLQDGLRRDIVEPFGSHFTLEPIDELCNGPSEAQESALALGEFGFYLFRRIIEAIEEACERAAPMSVRRKLVLEALCDVQEYARTLKSKIVLECGK